MASPSTVHPARYLALFLVLLIGAFLLVFLTGDKKAEPKLGIDLQGGTRVTLTARTPDGSPPSRESLEQAKQIIGSRVDGLGVSGSEVIIDGQNLVITVPGDDTSEARSLGQTARLYIRPVVHVIPAAGAMPPGEEAGPQGAPPGAEPGVPGVPPGIPGVPPGADPGVPPGADPGLPPGADAPVAPPAPQPRPFPQQPAPTPTPAPSPAPRRTAGHRGARARRVAARWGRRGAAGHPHPG